MKISDQEKIIMTIRTKPDVFRRWRGMMPDSPVKLVRADLQGADLQEADLREADLFAADLREADLREADLREADLRWADLRDADLCNARLRSARLNKANLQCADLRAADLRWANLRWANLWAADLRAADLFGACLYYADLRGAALFDAELAQAQFDEVIMNWASHDLIAARLWQAAQGDHEKEALAGLIRFNRRWCWDNYPADLSQHPAYEWALDTLAGWVRPDDGPPKLVSRRARDESCQEAGSSG